MPKRPGKVRAKAAPQGAREVRANPAAIEATDTAPVDPHTETGGGSYSDEVALFPMTVSGAATVAGWNVWTFRSFLRDTDAFTEATLRPGHGNDAAFAWARSWCWLADVG